MSDGYLATANLQVHRCQLQHVDAIFSSIDWLGITTESFNDEIGRPAHELELFLSMLTVVHMPGQSVFRLVIITVVAFRCQNQC